MSNMIRQLAFAAALCAPLPAFASDYCHGPDVGWDTRLAFMRGDHPVGMTGLVLQGLEDQTTVMDSGNRKVCEMTARFSEGEVHRVRLEASRVGPGGWLLRLVFLN
jgi:hypothetical protein